MCGIWAYLSKSKIIEFGHLYTAFMKLKHRGPDYSSFDLVNANVLIGFHRLAIMDLTAEGNQPFHFVRPDGSCVYAIANGEIYNDAALKHIYGIKTTSKSDCEVIIPLYEKFGPGALVKLLGSEFAFVIIDIDVRLNIKLIAGRDPIGVRPLFYAHGINDPDAIILSSEIKGLVGIGTDIQVFPPGAYMEHSNGKTVFTRYYDYPVCQVSQNYHIETVYNELRQHVINAVFRRLKTDREFGCLLSGGLDSSLVVGITKYLMPDVRFPVFTITFKSGGTDLPYAQLVAKHLGLDHHVIEIDEGDAIREIDDTIYAIESYDITTVRASVMQKLVAKYIAMNTNIKVLLVGENSDELFLGYLYEHLAPSVSAAHLDSLRLVQDVHRFDGLRADRSMSSSGLEVRLPFADVDLVNYVYKLDPAIVVPQDGIEKALLRDAFKSLNLIPNEVLYRRKEAFSDAVKGSINRVSQQNNSWYQVVQAYIDTIVTDEEYEMFRHSFDHLAPVSKESYYYRKKFVEFFGSDKSTAQVIPYFWMPKWTGETNDPSARTLQIYQAKQAE